MKLKIKKHIPGWGYFENQTCEEPEEVGAWMVAEGYAVMIPETEGPENLLPVDLPCREILFTAGLETVNDIRNSLNVLAELKGISKKSAAAIKTYIEEVYA